MNRRGFMTALAGAVLVSVLAARGVAAQQVTGVPRVGLLHQTSPGRTTAGDEFREGMRSLGWSEGRTIAIEDRFANGDPAQLAANAAELAGAKVDVIVAISSAPARAARQATSTIPIVATMGDPISLGLAASLARPGGNVTGLSLMWPDVVAKQLEILKEAAPRASKIGVLLQADTPFQMQLMTELERAAPILGVSVVPVPVGTAQDLPRLFEEMIAAGADAYLVLNEPRTDLMRGDIAALALLHRLPGMSQGRRHAEAGVLLCYGANLPALHRRLAYYVDKILKGAKPADLPVEQPTTFEMVINLKTATALGLTVPRTLLARADEIIE
jgi:putative tryptophan/tyrosine transport system substrate-binding protein